MALVLIRLRLTIASRFRGQSTGAQLYFAMTWAVAAIAGLFAATGVAALSTGGGIGDALLLGVFTALSLPWIVGPLVEPSLADGVVDPAKLEQYPLSGWQQVTGLLAGALIAPTAAFTFLTTVGAAVTLGESLPARVVSIAVALSYTVLCVSASRAIQALLAGALRSRRGRDLSAIAAAVLVAGIYVTAQTAQQAIRTLSVQVTGPLGSVISWFPPGAAGRAMLDARDGLWFDFAVRLGIVVATIAAAMLAWAWALERRVRGTDDGPVRARGGGATSRLVPAALSGFAPGPTLAAASQQLRYFFFRSPRALQTLIIPPVMGVMVAHTSFSGKGLAQQVAAFAALATVSSCFNVFAYDGAGFGYLLACGAPLRRVLLGKALAPAVFLAPMVVAYALVEATLAGSGGQLLSGITAGGCVVLLGIGFGALASVANPSDQSRIGHRQGSFLRVISWFIGFFVLVTLGGLCWWWLGGLASQGAVALTITALTVAASALLFSTAARRFDRDPYRVQARLAAS